MIANLIGGFISILIGVSLVGPISTQVVTAATSQNGSGVTCANLTMTGGCENAGLYLTSSWEATVLKLVPGFFALGVLGIGIATTYSSLRQAGIV